MSNTRTCPECNGIVAPFKRGMDPDVALYNHIRLSHPSVKLNLVLPLIDLHPSNQGATQ